MHILPEIIEQTGRNKKTFSIPSKLFEENIVTLFDEVDDDLAYTIITQLLYLDTIDTTEPVKLYICSPGGSVTAGLAIIDVMNLMTRKVDTVGIGSVASMGAMLLCSGTGERKALENTRIMLHSVSSGSSARTEYQVIELK
jgi:ATP-dependent Clp protease protease subunit